MDITAQLWFDTEDFITPEADDALFYLLVIFMERSVPVTFKLVAEKARMLERRKRYDVIGLLNRFEIGYHTEFHSVHPTVSEICEVNDFKKGGEVLFARENPGRLDVERITGRKCVCFGQPGNSWGAQMFPALLKMEIPFYMDSHNVIDGDDKPYWFGGMLNYLDINNRDGNQRMPLDGDGMAYIRKEFPQWVKKQEARGRDKAYLNLYYHPCEFSCTSFYDLNFMRGKNPAREDWKPAPLRPISEMRRLIDSIGDYVDYLREQNVNIVTPVEMLKEEKSHTAIIPPEFLKKWAKQAAEEGKINCESDENYSISPVEALSLSAQYILGKPLEPMFLYGSDNDYGTPEYRSSDFVDALEVARTVYNYFISNDRFSQLPDYFTVGECKVSPLYAAIILARYISNADNTNIKPELTTAARVDGDSDWSGWIIHEENFCADNILRIAKNQMWTFKEAIF